MQEALKSIERIKFTKPSTKAKWLLSVIGEEFRIESGIDDDNKEAIINELAIIEAMEDNEILEDSLLTYAKLYGGETKFKLFFRKLRYYLVDNTIVDSRQKDYGVYSYRFQSLSDMIEEISKMLPDRIPILSKQYLTLQFSTNNCRSNTNGKYYGQFDMKHMV